MTEPLAGDVCCARCGDPATGFAEIDGRRYCHGDDDALPTCYEAEQRDADWSPEWTI